MKIHYFLLIMLLLACAACVKEAQELNEFQVTACNSADEAGTCDTKLPDLDIVTKEECCTLLGKCC